MTPTNKLRWLNKFSYDDGYTPARQQWWADFSVDMETMQATITDGEWRDVEVVNEQT